MATDPEKTKLIEDWPTPPNPKQLRGFLGLSGYCRRFVEGYARIAAPLNDLMKKDHSFEWTDEAQKASDTLKRALASPPIPALPREEGIFILDTDAADRSIGSVLS